MDSISDYVDGICGHNRSDGQCNDEGVLGLSRNMQPKGVMRRCHLLPRRSKGARYDKCPDHDECTPMMNS